MRPPPRSTRWRTCDIRVGGFWTTSYGLARRGSPPCQGAVSEAIKIVLAAAETARGNGQFAAEVICLQTAAQFGDASSAPRLRELAATVEGPRVGLAARFADALHAATGSNWPRCLRSLSGWATLLLQSMRPRTRPWRIAARTCGDPAVGAWSGRNTGPTMRRRQYAGAASGQRELAAHRREREIVMLIGDGLSSRAVAERLKLSVRTVEGHIYRAMTKTGAASREELAALLPRHGSRTHQ